METFIKLQLEYPVKNFVNKKTTNFYIKIATLYHTPIRL